MLGKTPAEVARLSANLVTQASTPVSTGYSPAPQQTYSTPAAAQPGSALQPPDPQLIYSDPVRYQQENYAYQNAVLQASIAQATAPLYQQTAAGALSLAKRGRYADVWKRYEPEVLAELKGIPPQSYNEALLEKAAEIVQGRHWRDFVGEEVQRLQQNGAGTERTSAAGGPPSAPQGDALDRAWDSDHPYFVRARASKLSKADMRAHIQKNIKIPVDQFVKNITDEQVIVTERGFTRETF